MRVLLALTAMVTALLLTALPAGATSCLVTTLPESFAMAQVVVLAEVVKVDAGPALTNIPDYGLPVLVKVERTYKGTKAAELIIYNHPGIVGGPVLKAGERWVLFLHADESARLLAGPCAPSQTLAPGQAMPADLAQVLGPGEAPDPTLVVDPPGAETPGTAPRLWLMLGGGALLLAACGGLVAWYLLRKRESA